MITRLPGPRQRMRGPLPRALCRLFRRRRRVLRRCVQGPWHRQGMTTSAVVLRWCATCLDETMFEQPECHDQHGGECPEWVCVSCGEALLLGFVPPERVHRRRRAARTVGHRVVA